MEDTSGDITHTKGEKTSGDSTREAQSESETRAGDAHGENTRNREDMDTRTKIARKTSTVTGGAASVKNSAQRTWNRMVNRRRRRQEKKQDM